MSEIKEAKSLRWLAIQFPLVENPKDDIEKLQSCINLYCTAAAEKIEQLTEDNDKLYRLVDDKIQENKRLTEHNAQILQFGEEWEALARKFEAENKKLTEENEEHLDTIASLGIYLENSKTNTVRKMQERLKQYIDVGHYRPPTEICFSELDVANIIDQIAKEMLEGEK
jgi:hypothetical protein